ncbi:MAG: spore germination protein [Clostridiales bacterium]|nr:spore germination protein [Clostridiales bacterium]
MVKIIQKNKNRRKDDGSKENEQKIPPEEKVTPELSKDLEENLEKFKAYLGESGDAIFRQFTSVVGNIKCGVVFLDGMVSKDWVQRHIILPLIIEAAQFKSSTKNGEEDKQASKEKTAELIKEHVISAAEVKEGQDLDEAMFALMSGETILLIDGYDKAIIIGTRQWPARGVQEPVSEALVRGPRDGFTETLRFNTALLRRRLRDPNMVFKSLSVGRRSKTDIVIAYIKGIARPDLVEQVEKRIKEIDIDDISESGQIEQFIEDNSLSPFPQVQNTERPDKAAAALAEGRVVIMVDGTPFVLIVPTSLYQLFQSPEDFYERWIIGSLLRFLRWIGSFVATFAPALYIAIVSYHPGMLPTALAISVAASRETVPFPAFVEALLMEITIELLRESGARLPKAIGQTIGIVGAIVIGDAAVRAGITSPFMVIIVAVTAISSFIIPSYSVAIAFRVVRFPMMILAATLGLYGIMLGFIFINIHMVLLKSFGANYMSPLAPTQINDWKDVIIRLPLQLMRRRPEYINPIDIDRYEQDPIKEM